MAKQHFCYIWPQNVPIYNLWNGLKWLPWLVQINSVVLQINAELLRPSSSCRDVLHLLVCIFVDKESYCSTIMSPDTPQNCARTPLRPQKTKGSWLSLTFIHSHPTSSSLIIYRDTWQSLAFSDITRSFVEHCQIILGWHESSGFGVSGTTSVCCSRTLTCFCWFINKSDQAQRCHVCIKYYFLQLDSKYIKQLSGFLCQMINRIQRTA